MGSLILVSILSISAAGSAQKAKPKPKVVPPVPTVTPSPEAARPPPPEIDPRASTKNEAREHFDKGMELFAREDWDRALAELLLSREKYPTRSNTQNAAICLRNLRRFDEALDMFEIVQRDFLAKSEEERASIALQLQELAPLVGSVDVAVDVPANITIDGRDRGKVAAPLRVATGSHLVTIYSDGYRSFERPITVAGGQVVHIDAKLQPLTESGRLSVVEVDGKSASVIVDGAVVGTTPWQGAVPIGQHVVLLRGGGVLGTQPATTFVRINQVTPVVLAMESLDCHLRVEATPNGAAVAIDGVVVGAGLWDGQLKRGPHRLEVAQVGFLSQTRALDLVPSASPKVSVVLDRDPTSPLWNAGKPLRFFVELAPAVPFGLVAGGDVASGGSSTVPLGVTGRVHGGIQFPSGLGVTLDLGYLYLTRNVAGHPATLSPVGKPDISGQTNDRLSLSGFVVGVAGQLRRGDRFPLTVRLGLGAMVGTAADRRDGVFANAGTTPFEIDARRATDDAVYLYASPEVRLGYKLSDLLEVNAGLDVTVLLAAKKPRWDATTTALAGQNGFAAYPAESLFGATIVLVSPGIGARATF